MVFNTRSMQAQNGKNCCYFIIQTYAEVSTLSSMKRLYAGFFVVCFLVFLPVEKWGEDTESIKA